MDKNATFEGNSYITKKGGFLKILPWNGDKKGSHKYYPVVCSICHKDHELFPEPLLCKKSDIIRGVNPCGCGSTNWKDWQYKIIYNRKQENLKIVNWGSTGFIGLKTVPTVYCSVHNKETSKHSLHHLLYNNEIHACSICSQESHRSRSCYPMEKALKELDLHFESLGGRFLNFVGEYKGLTTKVEWVCDKGHKPKTLLESLIKNNKNCNICKLNGFRDHLGGYFYLVMFSRYCKKGRKYISHLKYGITNKCPVKRNKKQISNTSYTKITPIAYIFFEYGGDARKLEKSIKNLYSKKIVNREDFPDGYTETIVQDILDVHDIWGDLLYFTGCSVFNGYHQENLPRDLLGLDYKKDFWLINTKTLEKVNKEESDGI